MGICEKGKSDNKKLELCTGNKSIPINIAFKALKSICKIIIKTNEGNIYRTGFFMKINESQKYLITNYNIKFKKVINDDIIIEIYNHKKFNLNIKNCEIKYYEEPIDITSIEIKDNVNIFNDIEFLNIDNNCFQNGYKIYENIDIFLITNTLGNNVEFAIGQIINVNNFEFKHNIQTQADDDISGCPILLLNNNINFMQVIGIHKKRDITNNANCGIFIGEIFNKNKLNNNNINNINNYIIAEINIKDEDVGKDIRIINSYEEFWRTHKYFVFNKKRMNENEIKKCEIKIDDKEIPFNYFYKFPDKGKYIIKYIFNDYLTNMSDIFYCCNSLTSINLSNFNTQNVTDMSDMFSFCDSLISINLTNVNTQNVTNMFGMFCGCESLTNIDLSYFNTQNVTDMSWMFYKCKSLTNINLSNFNTQNVINMFGMFYYCDSLVNVNLSNFNTQNVTNMGYMFSHCISLKIINLSNFNIQNVENMNRMFSDCRSLTNLNISDFDTQNVKDMNNMFLGCFSLKRENIILKDYKILLCFKLF